MAVLIIDDDEYKAAQIKKELREAGFREVWQAGSLAQSFARLDILKNELELVVLDWCFPTLDGEEPIRGEGEFILDEMERQEFQVPVIICSGGSVTTKSPVVVAVTTPDTFHFKLKQWKLKRVFSPLMVVDEKKTLEAVKIGEQEVGVTELRERIGRRELSLGGTPWAEHKDWFSVCEAFKGFPKLCELV